MTKGWVCLAMALAASPAAADKLKTTNGDVLVGTIVEDTDQQVVIETPVLGRLVIPRASVLTTALGDAALVDPRPQTAGLFGSEFLRNWQRRVQLGATGSRGNSETQDILFGLHGDYVDELKRWRFDAAYLRSESFGAKTKDQAYAELLRDWLFPGEVYFTFAALRWDYDKFQDWDHRGTLSGGMGWNLIDRETFDLRARTGLAVTKTFGALDDTTTPEALLGLELEWLPTAGQKVTAFDTLFPSLRSAGEFRDLAGVDWNIALGGEGLSLSVGALWDYESEVLPGLERSDLTYYGSLLYSF